MKPEWITPEVVRLARRLNDAGYQKDIKEGDWYMVKGHWRPALSTAEMGGATVKQQGGGLIPIPTLTQCLDFIESKGFYAISGTGDDYRYCRWKLPLYSFWKYQKAETRLEAAMLAVLKILGGE